MAPTGPKIVWKTFEAQHHLLAALLAAHPDLKLDYKKMAEFLPDRTASSIEHAMRDNRKKADELLATRQGSMEHLHGLPPPRVADDRQEMAHYFGASTPDGIQFQFREIKKNAETMRADDAAGVAAAKPATPPQGRKRSAPGGAAAATAKRSAVAAGEKKRRAAAVAVTVAATDNDDDDTDGEA